MHKKYKVVAIDFDGTLSNYDRWMGVGKFHEILDGAKEELIKMKEAGYTIVLWTTRGSDLNELIKYVHSRGIPIDYFNENPPNIPENCSKKKVLADVYIDDRAINFDGNWDGMAEKVFKFKTWYEEK